MSKKQWIIMVSSVLALLLAVFIYVFVIQKTDDARDVVEEVGEETSKNKEDIQEKATDYLGIDYDLYTSTDMRTYAEDVEKENEDATYQEIGDKLEKETGVMNRIAYDLDVVVDGSTGISTVKQVINTMLFYNYFINEPELKDIEDIKVLRTVNMTEYENSVTEDEDDELKKDKQTPNKVYDGWENYLLISDTEGFVSGKEQIIGYPSVTYTDNLKKAPDLTEMIGDTEVPDTMMVEVPVYLEEDIKVGDFLKEIEKMEVEVGGTELDLLGREYQEEYISLAQKISENGGEADKIENMDVFREYEEVINDIRYLRVSFNGPMGAYVRTNKLDIGMTGINGILGYGGGFDMSEQEVSDLGEYINTLKKDKYLMGDTVAKVSYEVDRSEIIGDTSDLEKEQDYFSKEEHVTPKITIDGEDFKMSVSTQEQIDNKGIFYQR